MNKIILAVSPSIVFLLLGQITLAEPVLQPRIQGSGFFVSVNNTEQVGYNCNISYTLHYDDFGERKFQRFQQPTYVAPSASGDVLRAPTPWPASTLEYSGFNYSCFRANQSQSSLDGLPGGTYHQSCDRCSTQGSILRCRCDGNNTSINVDSCGGGRNQICNNNGRLSCPGPC